MNISPAFLILLRRYKNDEKLRATAVLELDEEQARGDNGQFLKGSRNLSPRTSRGKFMGASQAYQNPRGTYDNGVMYSRRMKLTDSADSDLAQQVTVRINRLVKRRLRQRMPSVKAKRTGTEVYIFVAKGQWRDLEALMPSIFHTTNLIYKYYEKGYNFN